MGMFLFVGCSYTWGAGLQFEYLYNKEGYSSEELNSMDPSFSEAPPNKKPKLEDTNYYANEYRKKHRYADLVSKHFNKNYEVLNIVNGGSNGMIQDLINQTPRDGVNRPGGLVVVQFSDMIRDLQGKNNEVTSWNAHEYFDINEQIRNQIRGVESVMRGTNWLGFSWRKDLAEELISLFPERHIPIILDDEEVSSMEEISKTGNFNNWRVRCKHKSRVSDSIPVCRDTHLSSDGHKIIANSIIKKCERMEW